jgi:hypothetical protein
MNPANRYCQKCSKPSGSRAFSGRQHASYNTVHRFYSGSFDPWRHDQSACRSVPIGEALAVGRLIGLTSGLIRFGGRRGIDYLGDDGCHPQYCACALAIGHANFRLTVA